ncbi:MAG: D-alanyl-D-alanine carboxypeptidase [Actinomycetaceae bacterium]|nr:D-alanyl-D-alanine carboxypeptidase [Actinomycetaceae bacterium]
MQLDPVLPARIPGSLPEVDSAALEAAWADFEQASRDQQFTPGVYVVDAESGDVLLDKNGEQGMAPASVVKILTALTASNTLNMNDTLKTSVFIDEEGTLHLVGEGDLLLGEGKGDLKAIEGRAGIADIAAGVAKASEGRELSGKLVYHDKIFEGPTLDPSLEEGLDAWIGHLAPYAIERGNLEHMVYTDDPSADVAEALKEALAKEGVAVTLEASSEPFGKEGELLVEVESAPISEVVRLMLLESDNTLAEQLCRLSAQAAGLGTSLQDATSHVMQTTADLGLYTGELGMRDCSGLNVADRVAPRTVVEALGLIHTSSDPATFQLQRDMPIGRFTGTLNKRFDGEDNGARIAAKTGTLDEVASLAGYVTTRSGRVLIFHVQSFGLEEGAVFTRPAIDDFALALAQL